MAGSFTPAASIPNDKQTHQSIYNKMITSVSKPFKTTDMTQQNAIKIFEERKVRTVWDSDNPRRYWSDLKRKLSKEGSQLYAEILQLKMLSSDGKYYKTDVATTEQLFRLIQSIPSPKAEPFKLWMAQVAKERLDEMQDPELTIDRAMMEYKALGYSDHWINQRLKSIEIRKDLTDEWKRHGLQEGVQFATLTDIIYQTWSGKTSKEYKRFKGLKKENLRDNMTNTELALNMWVGSRHYGVVQRKRLATI